MIQEVLRLFSPKTSKVLLLIVLGVLIIIYMPLVVMMLYSFNSPGAAKVGWEAVRASEKWNGLTTLWYKKLFKDELTLKALKVSLIVTFTAVPISLIIGTMTALALYRFKFWGKNLFEQVLFIPLVIPEVVMGISLLVFFSGILNHRLGIDTIIIAHIAFTIPLVTLVVLARMQRLDPTLEEAAMDLGADELTAMRRVTLPLLMPGILAAALLAFPWSFNDFVITYFVAGVGATTLPIHIFSMIRIGVSPVVNAVSTLIIGGSLLLIVAAGVTQRLRKA